MDCCFTGLVGVEADLVGVTCLVVAGFVVVEVFVAALLVEVGLHWILKQACCWMMKQVCCSMQKSCCWMKMMQAC